MIVLTDLQKVRDRITVIDIPVLQVKGGEAAALVGPVDSGKEILFELLTGATRPTAGSVRLAGLDPYLEREAFSRRVDEVLEQVGLADHAHTSAEKLIPSLSRRLALGRALLNQPRVLLLADPFAGCEQVSITLISQVIRRQVEAGGAALIFAQEPSGLEKLCDTIHRLGRIVETYDPGEDQERSHPFMIPARGEDKIILVDPAEILFVFAQDNRAYLQTLDGRLETRFTLSELEKRLARSGFFRAHRAYLVNLQQVKEVIPFTRDSFSLRLKDAARTMIPLSKSAERELRDLLEY